MSADAQPALPPRLLEILRGLQDHGYASRLERVYLAAALAVDGLSDMDVVKYETAVLDESPDLSLWEEMAPVIRDTVMDVNALLTIIRTEFPQQPQGGLAETLSRAMDEAVGHNGGSPEARRAQEAASALQRAMAQMAQQITELGEGMRNPAVVSDRWNLLATVQRFRTLFRQEIGALVYDSASAFGEVNRRDVIPGYAEDLASAVSVRSTVADLTRVVEHRKQKIAESAPEDVQWQAQQMARELDTFGRTAGYRSLRAQDKRLFLELRTRLGQVSEKGQPRTDEVSEVASEIVRLAVTMSQVNNRTLLIQHDREVFAATGVKMEQAEGVMTKNAPLAARLISEAVLSAQSLYGRDPELDAFLRKARKAPVSLQVGIELRNTLNEFRSLLAKVPIS
ncbi:MAG: hypothetical protein M3Y59_20915 [Myxococcota bacterium]|nr:hypothetical protein [Myxococcota bacterium]